jgi:replication initiator protein RepSA
MSGTIVTTGVVVPGVSRDEEPRPGSRAARLLQPIAKDVARELAVQYGVCVRPIWLRRTDLQTGQTEVVSVPCGATLAAKCEPCAAANRRLRMQQIREGWHLTDEPVTAPEPANDEQRGLVEYRASLEFARAGAVLAAEWDQVADLDAEIARVDEDMTGAGLRGSVLPGGRKDGTDEDQAVPARKRSTRRRQDAPDLPRLPVADRTIPPPHLGSDGREHRDSMFVTLTLGSYGAVHSAYRRRGRIQPCGCGQLHGEHDPRLGTPVDPDCYDYRAAALDAIHFAKVIDRFWQNARRAVGWKLQYAGAVEHQKRLAPHAHFAIRGAIPRKLLKQVAAATYHQVWWPAHEELVYAPDGELPAWDAVAKTYRDPASGAALRTWDEALDALDADEDADPAHVVRLGSVDVKGVRGGSKDAEKTVRYITKYLGKDITDAVSPNSRPQEAHIARLADELAVLPCSPTCPNWLLYGIQPKNARPGAKPGRCKGKVHQRRTLGFTGRRVLVSRQWSNKTLRDHRNDRKAWVRALLALSATGGGQDQDQAANGDQDQTEETSRYEYELASRDDPDVPPPHVHFLRSIAERQRWRTELDEAKQRVQQLSATTTQAA